MTHSEIKAEFIMDIINGKYNLNETKKMIKEYESKYGSDFFADYDIEKKAQPWDSAYLNELKIKSMTGMISKQFILHLAEVSEYVHAHEMKKSNGNKKKYIIIGIVAGIILALVILFLCMSKANAAAAAVIANKSAIAAHLKTILF